MGMDLLDNCLINFPEKHLDAKIYRIIKVKHLVSLYQSERNALVSPRMWDDPFEKRVIDARLMNLDRDFEHAVPWRDSLFGQCWSFHSQSEALWRIYSPHGKKVRIRTTPRKLLTQLQMQVGDSAEYCAFLGMVSYLGRTRVVDKVSSTFSSKSVKLGARICADLLLLKRTAFSYEREVRLLYFVDHPEPGQELFQYQVDPDAMVESILLDPRMSPDLVKQTIKSIREKTSYSGTIDKSDLYEAAPALVISYPN